MSNKAIKIATHSGAFQADEVFGIAVLKLIYPDATVIRTRDPEIYQKCDIVLDVGFKYEPENNLFDHHQKEFSSVRSNNIPYASFGLIWKHFGMELVIDKDVHQHIDRVVVQPVDALDSGRDIYKNLKHKPFGLTEIVKTFNPTFDEDPPDYDSGFKDSLEIAIKIMRREIKRANNQFKVKDLLRDSLKNCEDPRLLILDHFYPWRGTVKRLSKACLFVIFPDPAKNWCLQTVDESLGNPRKALPKNWGGLENDAFIKESGIPSGIFCHKNLFLAKATEKADILEMARIALNYPE